MTSGKMPRRFWSYTAGKGDAYTEEQAAARAQKLQQLKETLPGLVAFGGVMFLALLMLLMMLAEFRGFYISQIGDVLLPR